jgi:beta-phosphoglucomutase
MAPKAVIFDFDGVVVDSEPLIFEATSKIFAEFGVELQPEDVRPGIGAGISYVTLPMQKYGIAGATADELLRRRSEEYLKLAKVRLRKNEGFDALITWIRSRRLRTALASSSNNDWIGKSMEFAGVDRGCFDVIVNGDAVARKKPFPDLFLAAAEGLGIPPKECVVIEDAVPGIEAAHRAGMLCIALAGTMPAEELRAADRVVKSLKEGPQALLTIPQA